jgi:general secretion pathway protein A
MYLSFFGLNEKPFSITPDPRYLFLSERHAEAMAHLLYGIREAGGFIQLTGEVGTGKTTIVRSLLAQAPENAELALILNPRMSALEFLLTLCEELGIGVPDSATGSMKELVDILNAYLLRAHAQGRRVVLVVDEAQNLEPEVLEQVRLLTNLETNTQKLLQIILIGQPELRELLARSELRQLAQRVTGRYHLAPLSAPETTAYVRHRLRVAGATTEIFSRGALRKIHRLSGGVPRVINILCDRALLGGYSLDRHRINSTLVRQAAREVFGQRSRRGGVIWVAAATLVLLIGTALTLWRLGPELWRPAPALSDIGKPAVQPDAPAPRPVKTKLTLEALLDRYKRQTSRQAAYTKLFALWHLRYGGGDTGSGAGPCAQAAQHGLACLKAHGSLGQLRLYNRPAILRLIGSRGHRYEVLMTGLNHAHALLALGPTARRVDITALSRHWMGHYVLLWRPAGGRVRTLLQGMSGARVRWLRERLERVEGIRGGHPRGDVYDTHLTRLVRRFQRAHGLTVDGIAGIETQLALSGALVEPGLPMLAAHGRGG